MTTATSTSRFRRILEVPFHPFLFGIYAVLFLWSQNVAKVRPQDVLMPLAVILGGTAVLFAFAWLVVRQRWRAALLLTAFSFLFFSYGHVFGSERSARIGAVLYVVIGLIVFAVVSVTKPEGRRASFVLNVVLAILVLFVGFTIITGKLGEWRDAAGTASAAESTEVPSMTPAPTAPPGARDIYLLMLERHAANKTLLENYGYDNSDFLDGLRERGFYVAEGTRAPYPKTPHSVQTTLNMEYLDLPENSSDWKLVYGRLKAPKTARFLKERGYKYVLMGSGYHSLRSDPFADINVTFDPKGGPVFSEFANVLYDSTALAALGERYQVPVLDKRLQWYNRALYQFREIPKIPRIEGPTFTFAHFLISHEPYVFDAKGNYVSAEEEASRPSAENYVETLKYQSRKTLELIDKLLAGPDETDPIIVIQADEGPGPEGWRRNTPEHYDWTRAPQKVLDEKFRILNAYHLPGVEDTGLYPTIGPVNSFRHIFNLYFGAGLEMLPDRSYVFRNELRPFSFIDVTERVRD